MTFAELRKRDAVYNAFRLAFYACIYSLVIAAAFLRHHEDDQIIVVALLAGVLMAGICAKIAMALLRYYRSKTDPDKDHWLDPWL